MGRTPSSCRQCRREREKLFLKGERCFTAKCAVERRKYPPGQHGAATQRLTEYAKRMREKQKARAIYALTERQFRSYFEKAAAKTGVTGELLLQFLERRLDNVIFRLGLAGSRPAARQIVRHGAVQVNGKKVNVPSFQVKINDAISVKPKLIEKIQEKLKEYTPPAWLSLDQNFMGTVVHMPRREDTERLVQESLIVEYYSK
ncbi:30S ribosomal protein S4 [Candidatus Saganbacteria bacterium]|nr:30S ribosomal protein S4 [Candidatus Saganbacteria bacterium]